ncbi:MAG: heimdallarchaeosortase [Candidatus Hodarchaeota archaeon]
MTGDSSATVSSSKTDSKNQPKSYHNDKLMIITLAVASIITFLLYTVPDWVFWEIPTRDIVSFVLNIFGVEHFLMPEEITRVVPDFMRGGSFPFLEATVLTPGINIPASNGDYWIVKACTGMQAGGLLVGVILVTNAQWKNKISASIVIILTLFITNALRISFHLLCVQFLVIQFNMDPNTAFYWAHDVSSKVIGFFGTILFALIIERMGVPIIDQFADWLDWIWWRSSKIYARIASFV